MLTQTELTKKSKTELKNWIETEKCRAVFEISQIESSIHGLLNNGQSIAHHPLRAIREMTAPTRNVGIAVGKHPVRSVSYALLAGLGTGLLFFATRRNSVQREPVERVQRASLGSKFGPLPQMLGTMIANELVRLAEKTLRELISSRRTSERSGSDQQPTVETV